MKSLTLSPLFLLDSLKIFEQGRSYKNSLFSEVTESHQSRKGEKFPKIQAMENNHW